MKKSIYCVGQKVIFNSLNVGRIEGTIEEIDGRTGELSVNMGNGTVYFINQHDPLLQCVVEYLDPTSHDYHHSRFAEFQGRLLEAFSGYMFAYNEMIGLPADVPAKIRDFVQNDADQEAEKYAAAVELRDLAAMNLHQWYDWEKNEGYTLDHHFPFINPNNLQGYHKL